MGEHTNYQVRGAIDEEISESPILEAWPSESDLPSGLAAADSTIGKKN